MTALDAVTLLPLEQTLGTAQPAASPTEVTVGGERQPDPKSASHCRQLLVGPEMSSVGALQKFPVLLLTAEHVAGDREQLQV